MTKIVEQILHNDNGERVGKLAIIFSMDLKELENDIIKYVGDVKHNQFVDITLLNPWTRVIISGINQLDYHTLGVDMESVIRMRERNIKINQIL